MKNKTKKDFLTLKDYSKSEILHLLDLTGKIKKDGTPYKNILDRKNIALLFDMHSTRTRLSFEAGINQLGGNAIYLDSKTLQLSRGETYADTAKIFSGYLDGVVIRTFYHETVETFAENGTIPVINGLTDKYHPCQALADLFTLKELSLLNEGLKFSYIGDCNNVTNSLIIGLFKLGIGITIGCPGKYSPSGELLGYIREQDKKYRINIVTDPVEAVKEADIIYTDAWISMSDKDSGDKKNSFKKYQVNSDLLNAAGGNIKVMHCLPAHRGEEITAEVLEGEKSIVMQQAENRLYAQKALLVYIYSQG